MTRSLFKLAMRSVVLVALSLATVLLPNLTCAESVIATVASGAVPSAIALNPITNKVYIANGSGNTVTIIDGATNTTNTVATGINPYAVALNQLTNKIYVTNLGSNNVTVIDGATNSTTNVSVGSGPVAVAVNPVTNKVYVANYNSNNITIIDGVTNSTTTVVQGTNPRSVAVNPVTNKVYVANWGSNNVTVIDGATNSTTTVVVATAPVAVAVNPVTNMLYVANFNSNNFTVIDGSTNSTTTIAAGTNPSAIVVNPVTNKIYIINRIGNSVTAIDGATNSTTTVATGTTPYSVAVNPATNKVYVANYNSAYVTIIDGATNSTTTVAAGTNLYAVGVNPVTNKVYVANYNSATVTVIDAATNGTATVAAGTNPEAVAVNPVTNKVYVANPNSNNVTVINGTTNSTTTVTTASSPQAIAINPITNKIYVACYGNNYVTIIDGATNNTDFVAVGTNPRAITVNPITNKIYVANYWSNDVTIIDGATNSITSVGAGSHPVAITVNPVTNKVYVANYNGNTITVIDGVTNSTATVVVGTFPTAIVVNPVTNKIYVANQSSAIVTVIDGLSNSATPLAVGYGPIAISVNQQTNKIYVASNGGNNVTIIDGATNSLTTVPAGTNPSAIAVNMVTNKIYVANYTNNNITVIDGTSNSTVTVPSGTSPSGVAVNPITNKVYVTNKMSNNITLITEQQTQTNPLTTAIAPLTGNKTNSSTPSFTLTPTNGFTPNSTGELTVYYQVDTWQGPWLTTQPTSPLIPGLHILYAFAADAQAATSTNTGSQSSPLIGTMAAYQFLIAPIPNVAPAIIEGNSTSISMSKDGVPTAFSLTLHATDNNGDILTWSVSGAAVHGTAIASGTGASKAVAYTPTSGYVGQDSFIVQVNDGKGGTANITVNVTVIQTYTLNFVPCCTGALTGTTNQTVNIGASTTQVTAIQNIGYHFVNWTGTGGFTTSTDNPLTVSNVTASMIITANFAINAYALSTTLAGTGGGKVMSDLGGIDCGPTCSSIYNYGTSVTLTATPDATSDFAGWSGGACSGTETCQVTMDAAKNVTATFTRIYKTLTVSTSGYGSVTSSPNGIDCGVICSSLYFLNTSVSLTSIPSSGYHLAGWSGDCNGSSTCIVTMSSDRNVTANFAINTYSITASPGVNGSLDATTPSPTTVNYWSTTSFKFNANSGYYVSSVNGCGGSTYTNSDQNISSYTYTSGAITGICSVSAAFTQKSTTGPTFSSASYFGGTGDEHGTGIAITNGILSTVGYGSKGGILARYALPPDSTPSWSTAWPNQDGNDNFLGVAVTSSNVYTAGSNYNRTSDSGGDKEPKGLVAQFLLTGATGTGYGGSVWDVQTPAAPGAFPYLGYEGLNAILNTVEASNDFIYATGLAQIDGNSGRLFLSKLNAAGTIIWTVNDSAEMLSSGYNRGLGLTALNNYIYAAGASHVSGTDQPYLRKYDQNGTLVWKRISALSGSYQGVTAFGGAIYAVGQAGALDFLIEKWDEAGNILWTKQYDRNSAEDILNGVTGLGSSIYAAGTTKGTTAGGSDAALLEIDPATGNLLSTTLWGGSQDDAATGIATDGQDLYLIGNTASYGGGAIDMVLLRFTVQTAPTSKVLVAGGMSNNSAAPPTAEVFDQATGTWSSTSNTIAYVTMPISGICGANMTLLGSGKALIAGGSCGGDNWTTTNATSLYDPATNLWSTGASMAYGRNNFGLVTLASGDALAFAGCAGGCSGPNVLGQIFWTVGGTAERYSSTNNSWTTKQPLTTKRAGLGNQNNKTVTLQDGKVLVCGGNDGSSYTYTSCEIYDPSANTWAPTAGSYPELYGPTGLVLLDSGKVLSAFNNSPGAALFDPVTRTWSATGAPLSAQNGAQLVKLSDGRVLMTGGYVNSSGTNTTLTTAQIYDPTSGTWAATGSMGIARFSHFTVLLEDGKVLTGGGVTGSTTSSWGPPVASAEIFDPATGVWSATGAMTQARWNSINAVRLLPPIVNNSPVITEGTDIAAQMSKDGAPTAFSLILHSTDIDGDTLTWSIVTAAAHGTATANGTGASKAISYTPTPGYVGPDSFAVQVNDGKGGTDSITVNVTVIQTYTLNFVSDGNGTLTGTTSQTVNSGTATTAVTAVPSLGYHFVNWTGTGGFVTTTANPLTVSNLTAAMTITANFAIDTFTLTVSKTGAGSGTVTSSPAGVDCGATCSAPFPVGGAVVLFQNPTNSSGFSGWGGGSCSGTGDCAFSMSTDKTVSANFTSSPLVKNQRTGIAYSLLQTACTEASGGDTIMALTTLPAAALTLDAAKSLTIEGGYNSDYVSCTGLTPVLGPVTIKALTWVSGLAIRSLPGSTNAITAFSFASPAVEGVVSEETHSIAVTVPSGTDITALVPTITHSGAGISPASGEPRDFTSPVVYTVTAEDLTTQDYTVTVTVAPWTACGDVLTYAGENYPTVQIGTQCWTARNLNIGSFVTATSAPDTSCSAIQKFCYGNNEANCAAYGGLYTWNQAMCGAQVESAQGLCPSGWHVPGDAEFVTLANYLGPGGCTVKPGGNYPNTFCGAPAGDRLKATGLCQGRTPCGDSEFNALLGGYFGYDTGPVFGSIADQGSFWTSSKANSTEAWRRGVALDYNGVDGSYFWTKITGGRSIRCVKD